MADLTFLNEASVLHNLRQRYHTKLIYVSVPRTGVNALFPLTGEELQEGAGHAGEPAQVRKSRGYVQLDIPQRRFGFAQPEAEILQ